MLILTAPSGWFTYQIANVHLSADPQVAEMRVRFVATSELASQMKPGDSDGGAMASGSLYEAVVTALGPARPITAAEAGSLAPLGGNLRAVDATLRLPVDQVNGVWMYKNQRLKTGAPLTFETLRYVVHGEVIDLKPPASPATTPGK
jgi:hypothetical protein